MSERLSQQDLEAYLWGAAKLLRGLVDAGDYKQYIFPLLFFKRLSDVWDEEYAVALAETKDKAYARATADDRFTIPDGAHWSDVRSASRDVGRALLTAFRAIEAANPERLSGVFGNASWTDKAQMPDSTLKNLIEHFSRHSLSLTAVPEDELGNAYEYLIKQFADDSGHTAQEFYTNRTLVHLMTQMLAPKNGESIYDPTAGTGGMLISALAEVKRRGGDARTLGLYGQELIHITAAIARMNLVLHGVEDFEIVAGNTLSNPAFTERDRLRTFDLVLANPPYSIKKWNREAWQSDPWGRNFLGTPPQGRADYAFWQHILASMKGFGVAKTLTPGPSPNGRGEKNYRGGYRFAGLTERIRTLRKEGTTAEYLFWELVRDRRFLGLKFRRQHQIGDYIADFYCHEARIVVEFDGPVHDKRKSKDTKRDQQIRSLGNTVLRFKNEDILSDPEKVLHQIGESLPSPAGRGDGGEGDCASGRCAILFPHGVLFRNEESEMRRKLIESDLLECVLGLGPNLFYNSPMEACVVVCRTRKPAGRKGKVLFIDAVKEVTRERANSFLKPEHQARILAAYQAFADEPGFAKVATTEEILAKDGNLSIPRYVRPPGNGNGNGNNGKSLKAAWKAFEADGREFWKQMDKLCSTLTLALSQGERGSAGGATEANSHRIPPLSRWERGQG